MSYENQANKSQRHIKFKVGNLVWLNINFLKMFETLVNKFVPKYVGLYKMIHKPHPRCVYFAATNVGSPFDLPCVQIKVNS